jgi:hypothetical protein
MDWAKRMVLGLAVAANVGALARGASAATLLFHTTLDDPSAVTAPAVGSGVGALISTQPANDFVAGYDANGLRCDAIGESVRYPQTDGSVRNVETERGTVEFWYRPFYDHDDNLKYTIFGTGDWLSPGSLHFGKHNHTNQNGLFLIFFDASGTFHQNNVLVGDYGWNQNDWVLVRLTWDFTVAAGEQNLHLYLNQLEVPIVGDGAQPASSGPLAMPAESTSSRLYIGCRDQQGTIPASGVYDEVRTWDEALPPLLSGSGGAGGAGGAGGGGGMGDAGSSTGAAASGGADGSAGSAGHGTGGIAGSGLVGPSGTSPEPPADESTGGCNVSAISIGCDQASLLALAIAICLRRRRTRAGAPGGCRLGRNLER